MSEMSEISIVGQRIVVTGMAGAGKSTFSCALATKTGLPVIHLDLHIWKPGWVRVPEPELLVKQRELMADGRWIVDSNDVDHDLLIERADTLVVLDTPWWLCAWRALRRGVRRPPNTQLPEGCDESIVQRLGDEWGIAWRNWRNRRSIRQRELGIATRCQGVKLVYVLVSKQEAAEFIDRI